MMQMEISWLQTITANFNAMGHAKTWPGEGLVPQVTGMPSTDGLADALTQPFPSPPESRPQSAIPTPETSVLETSVSNVSSLSDSLSEVFGLQKRPSGPATNIGDMSSQSGGQNATAHAQFGRGSVHARWSRFTEDTNPWLWGPNYSKVHIDRDPFEDLQDEIETKRANGRFILASYFNARTTELRDIDKNKEIDNHTPGILLNDNRENDDKVINTYGRKRIDLCKNNGMILLNGRMRCKRGCNDKGYTCYRYNGSRVVDYTIAELDIIGQITHFEIGKKWHEYDHCPIKFEIRIKVGMENRTKKQNGAAFC